MSKRPSTPLLDRVSVPADLKSFGDNDLRRVADELRAETISAGSETGGHLGAGLGVVELTVALHAVFDSGATVGHALAWAVAISGVVQLALLIYCARREGMGLALRLPRWGPDVARLLRLMGPAAAAHGVVQFNLIVNSALAASLAAGKPAPR